MGAFYLEIIFFFPSENLYTRPQTKATESPSPRTHSLDVLHFVMDKHGWDTEIFFPLCKNFSSLRVKQTCKY